MLINRPNSFGFDKFPLSNWKEHYKYIRNTSFTKPEYYDKMLREIVTLRNKSVCKVTVSIINNFIEDIENDYEVYKATGKIEKPPKTRIADIIMVPEMTSKNISDDLNNTLSEDIVITCSDPNLLTIAAVKKVLIKKVLVHTKGNMTKAAKILGVSYRTLTKTIKGY